MPISLTQSFRSRLSGAGPLFLLLSFILLSYALTVSNGMYDERSLLFVGVAWLALCAGVACFVFGSGKYGGRTLLLRLACAVSLLMLLFVGLRHLPGIYIEDSSFVIRFRVYSLLVALMGMMIAGLAPLKRLFWLRRIIFACAVVLFAILYVGILRASPSPVIDVFSMLRDSAISLLHGLNPYTTPFADPYGGIPQRWSGATVLVYPPTSLIHTVIGMLLYHDVRFLHAIAVLFVGGSIWWVARRRDESTAELLCLLWLAHPRGLFVVEQSWVDPVALSFLCITLLFLRRRLPSAAAAFFGLFLSLKIYLMLALIPAFRITRSFRHALWLVVPPLVIAIPFLLWSPVSFIENAYLFETRAAVRSDTLTLLTFLFNDYGIILGKFWTISVGFIAAGCTFILPSGGRRSTFTLSLALIFFTFFFFGIQGFCNYYYFVCGLIVMTMACLMDDGVTAGAREVGYEPTSKGVEV